jgi:hypothetical protein
MKIRPSYLAKSDPLTEEQTAAKAQAEEEVKSKRELVARLQAEAEAYANGATVSLSDRSLSALAVDDQRVRRNIQWGVVRGMFLYSLFMIPVAIVLALIIVGTR